MYISAYNVFKYVFAIANTSFAQSSIHLENLEFTSSLPHLPILHNAL